MSDEAEAIKAEGRKRRIQSFQIQCSGNAFIEATPEQQQALRTLIQDSAWSKASIIRGGISLPEDWLDVSLDDSYYLGISPTGEVHS